LQQVAVVVVAQHAVAVAAQEDCYRHPLYQLVQEQVIPLPLEQVAHQAHMTQEVVPMLAHLAPIHHWVQLPLLSVAATAVLVTVLEQAAVRDRVVLVVVVGIPTDLALVL
jgi:hypothetical protein